jgi:hypothetical protein
MLPARFFAVIPVMSCFLFSFRSSWPQNQSQGQPPLPFTDNGACPFEGCQYAEWTAKARAVARRDANISSPAVFAIKSGEKITALNGKVVTRQFGIVRVLKRVVLEGGSDLPAGAVLYVLHGDGEGSFFYWYNGATHHDGLYAETVHKGNADFPWDVISQPKTEWWVNVKNHDGQTGWILNPFDFRGIDSLGGGN